MGREGGEERERENKHVVNRITSFFFVLSVCFIIMQTML